jgi:acetyl esterase
MPLDERLVYHAAVALCALPAPVQHLVRGGPIRKDGQTLDPELHALLLASERLGRQRPGSPAHLRREQNKGARIVGGPRRSVGSVRDLEIEGAAGPLRARHYAPGDGSGAPLLLFFHGGGFVFGDLDTHDAPCRLLCRHASAHVLAVDYRLAPEHPFPAAVEDARAALAWAHAHARGLGADPERVGVAGDSAGGNLAAVTAQLAARDGGPAPACQLLVYPAVDRRTSYPSLELFREGFFLTHETIDWFHRQYSGGSREGAPDPRLDPLAAKDLSGLAPALVVTAGFDPLRDEGEAYAFALQRDGSPVTLRRFESLIHGFFNMVGVSRACREAVVEIAGATRMLLARKT